MKSTNPNWTTKLIPNSLHVLASNLSKLAMASKLVPNITTTRVVNKARLKARESYSPTLLPTFNLKSKPSCSSTQINLFFLPPIHNYHNSTFKRNKQTSNYNLHRFESIEFLINFYVWSLAFCFEQNPLDWRITIDPTTSKPRHKHTKNKKKHENPTWTCFGGYMLVVSICTSTTNMVIIIITWCFPQACD